MGVYKIKYRPRNAMRWVLSRVAACSRPGGYSSFESACEDLIDLRNTGGLKEAGCVYFISYGPK